MLRQPLFSHPSNPPYIRNHHDIAHIQSSSSNYLVSPDRMVAFESLGHMFVLSSTLEFENGDVISRNMVDFGEDDFLMDDFSL